MEVFRGEARGRKEERMKMYLKHYPRILDVGILWIVGGALRFRTQYMN